MKKAFTLIELLVVVLIIGILAAVALPQYEKAVFKSRLAEVMINVKTIEDCFNMYVMENGLSASGISLKDMGCAAELSGGEWDGNAYETKYFSYRILACTPQECAFWVLNGDMATSPFLLKYAGHRKNGSADEKECYTNKTSLGRLACHMFEDKGYSYEDEMD